MAKYKFCCTKESMLLSLQPTTSLLWFIFVRVKMTTLSTPHLLRYFEFLKWTIFLLKNSFEVHFLAFFDPKNEKKVIKKKKWGRMLLIQHQRVLRTVKLLSSEKTNWRSTLMETHLLETKLKCLRVWFCKIDLSSWC